MKPFVGTAGWSIPSLVKERVSAQGSHLERYAGSLNCVEINSSFYREHRPETYEKWAKLTPNDFAFSTKLLRYFTQEMRMKETGSKLKEALQGMSGLGKKWRVLLLQLPPSLEFHSKDAQKFLSAIRKHFSGEVVWEPRHESWISEAALDFMAGTGTSKVLADPDRCFLPFRKRKRVESLVYYRLHGSPVIYKSSYSQAIIQQLSDRLKEVQHSGRESWCIFDNTTFGHATENALDLISRI